MGRSGQHEHISVEGHQLADGERAGKDHLAAKPQDQDRACRDEKIGGRHDLRPGIDNAHAGVVVFPVSLVEALHFVIFARKGTDDLCAADVLLQSRRQFAQGEIDVEEKLRDAPTKIGRDEYQREDRQDGYQGQPPVFGQHNAERAEQQENQLRQLDDRTPDELLD